MTNARRAFVAAGFVATTVAVATAARPGPDRTTGAETTRLRAHFAVVLRELRAADVSRLSATQRAARADLIARLEQYAAAGRFPHNHVVARSSVPVFRDEHGTLCAMGFLIASTGRDDIVEDVVREANLARIPALARDARLAAWLDSTGLTVAEAARIQPAYEPCPPGAPEPRFGCWPVAVAPGTEARAGTGYYVGSAVASAVSGATTMLNMLSFGNPKLARRAAAVGFVTGATQLVLGAFVLDQAAMPRAVGVANMVIGGASIGTSVWRAHRLNTRLPVAARNVSVAPIVSRGSAGVMLAAKL